MQYNAQNLIVHPNNDQTDELILEVTPQLAGWDFIHFQSRRLAEGKSWSFDTKGHEFGLIILSGKVDVTSNRGTWTGIGKRKTVFEGPPFALYLPAQTSFTVTAQSDAEFGVAWVPTDEEHPPQLVTPDDVNVEIRGGDNATRQINDIFPPGFDCHRLVVVEVYTPSGGWSSYPPHKHDVHREDAQGQVVEADLEEVYYYKIDKPEGYAYQRVYTDAASPLHQAGFPIDALMVARNNSAVLVPEGYHPVVSPPGYTTYYLNILAGSAQSLANVDDPNFAWVKETYGSRNPAIPLY